MKTVLLSTCLLMGVATNASAQAKRYELALRESQQVFVCNNPEAVLDVVTGLLQEPADQVDKRPQYMAGKDSKSNQCDYLRDAQGNVLLFLTLSDFEIIQEEKRFFAGQEVMFGLYRAQTPAGLAHFVLLFLKPVNGLYTEIVEPIGLMPDQP